MAGSFTPIVMARKRRATGSFHCDFVGCGKVFSRSDHLLRHKANHSSKRLRCDWPGCDKTFTRLDVKKKHESRHKRRRSYSKVVESNTDSSISSLTEPSPSPFSTILPDESADRELLTVEEDSRETEQQLQKQEIQQDGRALVAPCTLSQSELIRWLTEGSMGVSPNGSDTIDGVTGTFFSDYDSRLGSSTVRMLKDVFAIDPQFPSEQSRNHIDDEIVENILQYIPSLQDHPDFNTPNLNRCLEKYWQVYHTQYPILHRPSFDVHQVHPLLLLSMLMMGASYSHRVPDGSDPILMCDTELAAKIAEPLRWLIFSSTDARSEFRLWVMQSLLILECYENARTSRRLYERGFVYHNVTSQMLRRNPILGDSKSATADSSSTSNLWKTWIEAESMKRVAFMSFYMDTLHAVVHGYPIGLVVNEIKLSLPCPDDLWENENIDRDNISKCMPLFSDALQRLLNRQPIQTSSFGHKIIFAGLMNLYLQMNQKGSLLSGLSSTDLHQEWKGTIISALEFWRTLLPEKSCCSSTQDAHCSVPEYHAAQMLLRFIHYDYVVYSGSPKRMNVPIIPHEYNVVARRIHKWAISPSGPICAVYCYIFLCEMLLSPEDSSRSVNYLYEPDNDGLIYRPAVVISMTLTLWAYCFELYGPESMFKSTDTQFDGKYTPALEDAGTYLRRVRSEFKRLTGRSFASIYSMSIAEHALTLQAYAEVLPQIPNLNNMVGLLATLRDSFMKCRWECGREYAKLFNHCIQRSLGNPNVVCVDMFENNSYDSLP